MQRIYRTGRVSLPREGIDDPAILSLVDAIERELKVLIGQLAGAPADAYTDGTIATDALADDAVTAAKIDTDAVGNAQLADNAVALANMQDDSVDTVELVDGAVTADKLDTDAVTKVKVANEAVGTNELDTTESTTSGSVANGLQSNISLGGHLFYPDVYADQVLIITAQTATTPPDSDSVQIGLYNISGSLANYSISYRTVDT